MKRYSNILTVLLAVLLTTVAFSGKAQARIGSPYYTFVVFETNVTKNGVETSDANPQERRFYVSDIVAIPAEDPTLFRNALRTADDYFIATIVEPLKAKGILHQYYDDAIHINNNVVYDLKTRADVVELRDKTLQELKEQNANVFTFNWAYGEKTNGLETARPTLFNHPATQPLYGGEMKFAAAPVNNPVSSPKPQKDKRSRKN